MKQRRRRKRTKKPGVSKLATAIGNRFGWYGGPNYHKALCRFIRYHLRGT